MEKSRGEAWFRNVIAISCLVSLVGWGTSSPAAAAEKLAQVAAAPGHVSFYPLIPYSSVRATVTGPAGFVAIRTFGAAETARVVLPGVDGLYKYELRFAPVLDEAARAALQAARLDGSEPAGAAAAEESTVQSGAFTIANGSLVPMRGEPTPEVVLTNGDGVVRNSLCVGFDCPDAPLFDDTTILLMENNTRLKFGDTSTAPFPNNDWEIEANSNLSGGANYLGFNDCGTADDDGGCAADLVFAVEAGARQNALYVEGDGDIGIGTANPVLDVHLVTGNTPSLRLDQDGSSGFTPQVWDIAANEANFFVRDVTAGSRLPLRIRPGAPTSAIDIAASGNVGLSTAAPAYALEVARTGVNAAVVTNRTDGAMNFMNSTAGYAQFGSANDKPVRILVNAAWKLMLNLDNSMDHVNGARLTAGGSWQNASSRSLKENVRELSSAEAAATLRDLTPVRYNYRTDPEERHVGFIAEDVPELVAAKDRKTLSPMDIAAVLTRVVQEQQQVIAEQAAAIRSLGEKAAALEAVVGTLRESIGAAIAP